MYSVTVRTHAMALHRADRISLWLMSIDGLLALAVALLGAGHGPAFICVPIVYVGSMYISGEYSIFSEIGRNKRRSVAFVFAVTVLIIALLVPLRSVVRVEPLEVTVRIGVAMIVAALLIAIHRKLKQLLLDGSRTTILSFGSTMKSAADAVARHIAGCGYPAMVETSADVSPGPGYCLLRYAPVRARSGVPDTAAKAVRTVAFCDEALRVLPPAVLQADESSTAAWAAPRSRPYDALKRSFDVTVAGLLFLVTVPFWILIAAGIRLSSHGPVLFRQLRVGRNGMPFELIKFRSLAIASSDASTPNDRIEHLAFPFGKFLRRSHLDELPQVLNILRGDMSVIGPRPEMQFFHDRSLASIPFYEGRLAVRPGLSGWAQVRFSHTTSDSEYVDKTAYDLWYVQHRSFPLDFKICVRTIGIALLGIGSR